MNIDNRQMVDIKPWTPKLGAVHMGTSNWEGALHAFEEALKLRRDSWKVLKK